MTPRHCKTKDDGNERWNFNFSILSSQAACSYYSLLSLFLSLEQMNWRERGRERKGKETRQAGRHSSEGKLKRFEIERKVTIKELIWDYVKALKFAIIVAHVE